MLRDYSTLIVVVFALTTIVEVGLYVHRGYLYLTDTTVKEFMEDRIPSIYDVAYIGPYISAGAIGLVFRLFFMGFQIPILALELQMCCCAVSTVSAFDTDVVIFVFFSILGGSLLGLVLIVIGFLVRRWDDDDDKKRGTYFMRLGQVLVALAFVLSFVAGVVMMFGGLASLGDGGDNVFKASLGTLAILLLQLVSYLCKFD